MTAPITAKEFDKVYRSFITPWGDARIPDEIKTLIQEVKPASSLELGCGIGRISSYLARQGILATGVDFSEVAIAGARSKASDKNLSAEFVVGDVTNLSGLTGPYDIGCDIGCFHCLDSQGQCAYIAEIHRLLKPGGIHLIWTLDSAPANIKITPEYMTSVFEPKFELKREKRSRRRLVASHWYWLVRR